MTRRRWVYVEGQAIEVGQDHVSGPRSNTDAALWNDRSYDGLVATDGTDISSRAKHREYMRIHNLTTIDDYNQPSGQWAKQELVRDRYRTRGGTVTKEDISRTIQKLEAQSRR